MRVKLQEPRSKGDEMTGRAMRVAALLLSAFIVGSCQSAPKRTVLLAPVGTNAAAIHHNWEGIHA